MVQKGKSAPLLHCFDLWDTYLSFSVYWGGNESVDVIFSGEAVNKLPRDVRRYLAISHTVTS
jgi:hypothetical protein